jgi:hypothetical protein
MDAIFTILSIIVAILLLFGFILAAIVDTQHNNITPVSTEVREGEVIYINTYSTKTGRSEMSRKTVCEVIVEFEDGSVEEIRIDWQDIDLCQRGQKVMVEFTTNRRGTGEEFVTTKIVTSS